MAVLKDLIVHGNSNFINAAQFNKLKANRIGAEEGVFNKLIATSANIGTLDVDDLTANNATVVGLLDVQGEMHTNSWTNASIANIGGSFYIAPTIIPTDGTTTITINKVSATSWTIVLSGTFATDFIKTGTNTTGQNWPANSLVLITGDITVQNMKYPLGTLKGTLSSAVTASAASTSKTVTITGVTDGQGNTTPAVLDQLWTINGANITNAAFSNGKISLYKMGSYPIGIQMSSMGTSSNSLIEIYGGVSTNPNVRIGHLAGAPAVNGESPTGWGIYTDNGYFSGVIVSTSGKIGGYTIDATSLYSGTKGNSTTSGHFTLTTGTFTRAIDGTSRSNLQIALGSKFGVANDGTLYANGANITNINATNIKTGTLDAGVIGATTITAEKLNVSTLSAITANMGTLTAGTISYGTTGNSNSFYLSANSSKTANIAGASRNSLRLTVGSGFGVDVNGVLYATGATIAGTIQVTNATNSNVYTVDEVVRQVDALNTTIDTQIGGVNENLNSLTQEYSELYNDVNVLKPISDHITISDNPARIDIVSGTNKVSITTDSLQIFSDDQLSSWFSGSNTYNKSIITGAIYPRYISGSPNTSISLTGGFGWVARSNGNLSLKIIQI